MRYIVLDTETTGLDPKQGHRLIEIGAIEMVERQMTGRTFHYYLNPDRAIDEDAKRIHGIDEAFLADKPRFADVAEELWAFCEGAELIIHNASFDMGFINHELAMLSRPALDTACTVRDTLKEARQRYPGKRNNLDALCERLGVDARHRSFHGALLDAHLLANVFLAMTRGQQSLIEDVSEVALEGRQSNELQGTNELHAQAIKVIRATPEENASHEAYIQKEIKNPLWSS